MARFNDKTFSKMLSVVALISLMVGGFLITKKKARNAEAVRLPFHNVKLEDVADGLYHGKTETNFMQVELDVVVENHQLKDIKIIKSEGVDCESVKPIIQEMIKQNKVVVPAIKGAELGSLVYISCVDGALYDAE